MAGISWLHLSDWHQKGKEFERLKVRDALLKDIKERAAISPDLAKIDFIIFSGDVAFSGKPEEYQTAINQFFTPLLDTTGIGRDRLFIVPGNHDIEWEALELLPNDLPQKLNSPEKVSDWLTNERKRSTLLGPMNTYSQFIKDFLGNETSPEPAYSYTCHFEAEGKKIAVVCLNSAWLCAQNRDKDGRVNDRGNLMLGEPQVYDALAKSDNAEIRIAVLHHPFDWLVEFEQHGLEERLGRECHFILRGHQHLPQVNVVHGTSGDCVIIPAGASYSRDALSGPRYANAYNFVHLDFERRQGIVYLRRWSDRGQSWIEDIDSYKGGQFSFNLPKELGKEENKTIKQSLSESAKPQIQHRTKREREVLESYLEALIRDNADLEPGGIKQTKIRVVLPLDQIYVSLQADRDRPDVDRRVLQEELDEIKKRLEREEDPKERERQYQIFAQQARPLQQALELSGPREELSNIVQRHRQLVVLGDPGSGKTTLLRYLALRFARAILTDPDRLFQPQDLWDEKNVWRLPDLGPVRLPILMRISHYAEARQKDPDLAIVDYLPRYFAGLQVPQVDELGLQLRRLLQEGRCILLLDGLDEIIDPTDRRNIATAIGQFAGVFREAGLPDWLSRHLVSANVELREGLTGRVETDALQEVVIQWDERIPKDVRQEWEKLIKERRRGARARHMARELLNEARYAHVGNLFVVTSRIAGYHFAGVPGDFEHYTIRRMSLEDIKLFLEKWCPAVERRIAEAPEVAQVEQRARREIDGILKAIDTTPGVRRMAENPLLLRILAIIHRNEAHLPQRRVELYETATVTLLRDWHLERGTKGAVIDDIKAQSLLGPVALYIHENRASGFLSKSETERILSRILSRERGEDPENPSLETKEAVRNFIETVRQHSGLFVERGEGLYGFMHLTFQEYYTARQLVSSSGRARQQILERLHLPRWREPILLAVGSLSKQFYDDTDDLLRAILDVGSDYEPALHRDLIFAASCVGDSGNVAPILRQEIAARLLTLYCDRHHAGRYRLLQKQVKDALLNLCNDQGDVAVEAALAEVLTNCANRTTLICALEAVDWLKARTTSVARALASCPTLGAVPRGRQLLNEVQSRLVLNNGNGARSVPMERSAYRNDKFLAQFLGVLWWSGWKDAIGFGLGLRKTTYDQTANEIASLPNFNVLALAEELNQCIDDVVAQPTRFELWQRVRILANDVYMKTSSRDEIEVVAKNLKDLIPKNVAEEAKSIPFWIGGRLEKLIERFRQELYNFNKFEISIDVRETLEKAGQVILKDAANGHTIMPALAAICGRVIPLQPWPGSMKVMNNIQSIKNDLADALLETLHNTSDPQSYYEATLFLIRTDQVKYRDEAVASVLKALEVNNTERQNWTLQILTEADFIKHVKFTTSQRSLLYSLLTESHNQAASVLEILFAKDIAPDLLSWCWTVIRQPNHYLAEAVRGHLEDVKEIKGTTPLLALLDEGLNEEVLRPWALKLLRKVSWQQEETFVQAIAWLTSEDNEVRELAALLLTRQGDLLNLPRNMLVKVTEEKLKGKIPPREVSWATLREDEQLMRLLGSLWLNGWDNALTQLLLERPAQNYLYDLFGDDELSPHTFPISVYIVSALLSRARYGQTLIPVFKQAAVHLAEIEGATVKANPMREPERAHISTIQHELNLRIESVITQPDTSFLHRFEAGIFASANRGEQLDPAPKVVTVLNEALTSPQQEQQMLALAFISERQSLIDPMSEVLMEYIINDNVDAIEALTGVGLLVKTKQFSVNFWLWLKSLVAPNNSHPLSVWLRGTLANHGLTPETPPSILATLLLKRDDINTQAAAALCLLAKDLQNMQVPALIQVTQSADDWVRIKAKNNLYGVCSNLPTDGSTLSIEWLHRTYQSSQNKVYQQTILWNALGNLNYKTTFWPSKWLDTLTEENNKSEQQFAKTALSSIFETSDQVAEMLCKYLVDLNRPERARYAAILAISQTCTRQSSAMRSSLTIQKTLISTLADAAVNIRRKAAYTLQWSKGEGVWDVVHAFSSTIKSDPDLETRVLSLCSLGRVLHTVRALDADISKDALLQWLLKKANRYIKDELKQMLDFSAIKDISDDEATFKALFNLDTSGLPEETVTKLCGSKEWKNALNSAQQEWQIRHFWATRLPNLPAIIADLENFVSSSDPNINRAAACALARLNHGNDDRPTYLLSYVSDDVTVLRAMLDAASDFDSWNDEGSAVSHHPWSVKQITSWIEAQPRDKREKLIDVMLDSLYCEVEAMERQNEKEDDEDKFIYPYSGWPSRRILMAVLAEVSERLTYRAFIHSRDLSNVVNLFTRATRDPGSYNTRRFAIRALGNLQQFTTEVADVFFEACQDVSDVYRETRKAVTKFKVFGPGSLEKLTVAVKSPSITVAYHAAILLGELGISRSEELGREGRKAIADELVRILEELLSERIIYDFSKDTDGERIGPLYDVIYEALVRVVAGPDAPTTTISAE